MLNLAKSRVVRTAIGIWAIFIPMVLFLDKRDLFAVTSALTLTAALAVLHAYWPAMRHALTTRSKGLDYVDFLTLGIMCSWFAISMRIAYVIFLRSVYSVPEELSSNWIAFLQYLNFTGALLHLSARRVVRNSVPVTSWPRIIAALVAGVALGVVLSLTN